MIDVDLNVNFDKVIDEIDDVFKRQVPFSAYLALNDTVFKTSQEARTKLFNTRYIQGGPTPFTKRGIRYTKAKDKRNLVASVYINDDQWKYLMWMVRGGQKRWGQSEHGIGVPIQKNVRFNKYGNIPGRAKKEKLWREILSRGAGRAATPLKGQLGKKQFIGKSSGGIIGLWQRQGPKGRGKPKLLVYFTHEAVKYKKTLPFRSTVARLAGKHFRKRFSERLDQVIRRESKRRV